LPFGRCVISFVLLLALLGLPLAAAPAALDAAPAGNRRSRSRRAAAPGMKKAGSSSGSPLRAAAALEAPGRFGPEELPYRNGDGVLRIASVRIGVLRGPAGEIVGQVGVLADITASREQQDALRVSEERFRRVLETIEEGIVMQDASGQIVLSNPGAERILGLTADQMRGVTSLDPRWATIDTEGNPLPGDQHPAMVTLRTGQPVSGFVMGVTHPERERVWIRINALPITLPGTPGESGVVTTFVDITEQLQLVVVFGPAEGSRA
jgi:PAS domain S-box-containing protein